jgi:hypothetical protein
MPQNSTKFISLGFEELFWDMLPSAKKLSCVPRILHTSYNHLESIVILLVGEEIIRENFPGK